MDFSHVSVLLKETVGNLITDPNGIYVDGTLGGAGHSYEKCSRLSEQGRLIGIDPVSYTHLTLPTILLV